MTKPLSDEAYRLLSEAPRFEDSPFVCPSIFDPAIRMTDNTYSQGWRRILKRAGIPHVGTHGIRHRAATEIANSGAPLKVGMALTAHKTVTQFMRYVHTEDDPVRMAADAVAANRRNVIGGIAIAPASIDVAPMDWHGRLRRRSLTRRCQRPINRLPALLVWRTATTPPDEARNYRPSGIGPR